MSTTHRRPKCSKRGCVTRLSRYNPGPRCFLHSFPQTTSEREHRDGMADLLEVMIGGVRP